MPARSTKAAWGSDKQNDTLARIKPCHSLDALAPAGLVIEAIVEDLEAKVRLFETLEIFLHVDAILASTPRPCRSPRLPPGSSIPSGWSGCISSTRRRSWRWSRWSAASRPLPEVVETVSATAEAWGKTAVVCRSTPGFVVNRVARPFYGEALRALAERAADAAHVDAIMRDAGGFRMGPFELIDLIGLDVNLAVSQSIHDAHFGDPRYTPSLIQREMVDSRPAGPKERPWLLRPLARGRDLGRAGGRRDASAAADHGRRRPRSSPDRCSSVGGPPGSRSTGAGARA